jgi:hypothetical protein
MAPPGWKDAIGTDARFEGAIFHVKRGGRVTMGVWGTGLYSGDFARDLRAAVAAVARLPFDPDKLVDILCTTEPSAANDPAGEDHTTFWLVVADQFAKIGIGCDRAQQSSEHHRQWRRHRSARAAWDDGPRPTQAPQSARRDPGANRHAFSSPDANRAENTAALADAGRRRDGLSNLPWEGNQSSSHFKKMELEKVGALSIDAEKLKHVLPGLRPGTSAAIQDISIANRMFVKRWAIPRPGENRPGFAPMILGIEQILHE